VRHDFDPKTSTVRLYLPRDLIDPVVLVNIRVRDAQTGQCMVANWFFNYQSAVPPPVHPPIGAPASATNAAPAATANTIAVTNAAPAISSSVSATTAVSATNQADPPQAAAIAH
jgi:hypothetical protein